MYRSTLLFFGLFCCLVPAMGCRGPRVMQTEVDSLLYENRLRQDQLQELVELYNRLNGRYESCKRENDHFRQENERLHQQLRQRSYGGGTPLPPSTSGRANDGARNLNPVPDVPEELQIEHGVPAAPTELPGAVTEPLPSPHTELGPPIPPGNEPPEIEPIEEIPLDETRNRTPGGDQDSTLVAEVVLNPRLTGGRNLDSIRGDEGLLVVIEPRDAQKNYVPVAGDLQIELLDPTQYGDKALVACWEFSRDEAARNIHQTAIGKGIQLEIPWANQPPTNPHLMLAVTYTTSDGRTLHAKRMVHLDLPRETIGQWTPASTGRYQRYEPPAAESQLAESPAETEPAAPGAEPGGVESPPIRTALRDEPSASAAPSDSPAATIEHDPHDVWRPQR